MLNTVVNQDRHRLVDRQYAESCRVAFERDGMLLLDDFLNPDALAQIRQSAVGSRDDAYFCAQKHTVYLLPSDPLFAAEHVRNQHVVSSKGCICDDQVGLASPLRLLYHAADFQKFVQAVTGQLVLYPYADRLSSINVHYAERGQELGWHFDNSTFAITLMVQKAAQGGCFEFVRDVRETDVDPWNFEKVADVLENRVEPEFVDIEPGTLVLFRGQNSLHRVTPNLSDVTRILAVLAYNTEPNVALSENARMTFYGRLN